MRLSDHFTLAEFTRTTHRGYLEANAEDAREHLPALHATAALLEQVRAHFGVPVVIHSGHRCRALNAAVNGSPSSQHTRGEAADFHLVGVGLLEAWHWIGYESGLPFGQVILEGYVRGEPSWLHLSLGAPWRAAEKCGQVMTWDAINGYSVKRRAPQP